MSMYLCSDNFIMRWYIIWYIIMLGSKVEDIMEFIIERARKEDAKEIAEVIWNVWEEMEEKQWFVVDSKEYTCKILMEERAIAYKAVEKENGKIAGIFTVIFPGILEENLGNDIGLNREELEKVAHMESAAILPIYRGNGLQYHLMQAAEIDLAKKGYHYLMCTIHPDNKFSKDNVMRQGYRIVKTTEKYGGYMRHILLKRI